MAGGFTKYNKLEVTDLGTEGTGDRIALFNSDGRLIGYVLKENLEGFVPLSGTEVGKPITGNLEFDTFNIGTVKIKSNGVTENDQEGGMIIQDGGNPSLYSKTISTEDETFLGVNTIDGVFSSTNPASKGILGVQFYNKLNDPNAFAQLGDIATGFESGYTTTTQAITATTDTIIDLSGASFESDGGLNLIDGTSGKITPLLQGDILSIDIAMPLLTPVGTNEYCTMTLVPFGTTDVYRAITHQFIKGAGNQDYISANWTVPIGADIITAGGLSIVINSTAGITIDSKYISVSRLHRTKN